ncbi:MAG: MFS transporter [Deltaproteobacteria bacterium]|nr:MAG: MFS transporter [Deltaproteobacteria bacterium]
MVYNKKWKVFSLVAVSIFMSTLDSSIVNVALPYIMQEMATDISTIQWVVVIYLLTVSSLLPTFGRLSDIKGRRPIYVVGFMVFTLGSFLCGAAGTVSFLVMARVVQGAGASMLMACSPALIVDMFEKEQRGHALGMIGAVVAAGLTLGPVAGGIILEYLSWRYIFYINIPIGIAATIAGVFVLKTIPGGKGSREPLDYAGSLTMMIGLSSFILGLTQVAAWGILSFRFAGCLMIAGLACAGFIINAKSCVHPLFDLDLLKIRLFVLPLVASGILFAALFTIVFMMPFYLTYPCNFSAGKTGGIMIVPFLFLLFISPVAGGLSDRLGSRCLCFSGMVLLGLSLLSLIFLSPEMETLAILWRMALAGVGTALFVSPNNTAIMGAVPMARRGIASGATATARNLGMVMGVALATTIFTRSFTHLTQGAGLDNYTPALVPYFMVSFQKVMGFGAMIAFIGAAIAYARGKER